MERSKLKNIKLLLMDVDGVLTEGDILYSAKNIETKKFNVKDGLGIRMLQSAGIAAGIVTGRSSAALLSRCRDLDIRIIYDGVKNKGEILDLILSKTHLQANEIAFVGDDLPDIPLMKKVGVGIAVGDAHEVVKNHADIILKKNGGTGAVRELCEMLLTEKNLLEKAIENYL